MLWAVVAGAFVIAFYIPWWLAVLGIIPAVVAWTGVFGNIWLNGLFTPWVLGFILLKVLYPYVKRWNMYWADSENADADLGRTISSSTPQVAQHVRPALNLVEMRDVVFRYPVDPTPALDGVSLSIEDGEIVGLAGPTGAGKTTLCLALTGLVPHSTGRGR